MSSLSATDKYFIAPRSLATTWYQRSFPEVPVVRFPSQHFRSIEAYSEWMLRPSLYRKFQNSEFVLICQTDAILHRPLPVDEPWDFDYLGAPWYPPKLLGWDSKQRRLKGRGSSAKRILEVGNGGLSLRRTSVFATRLGFPRFSVSPQEDKAISYFGPSLGIRVANARVAGRYFMETAAAEWQTGDPVPDVYGFHGLEGINRQLEDLLLYSIGHLD
jgi:hypothetical protein